MTLNEAKMFMWKENNKNPRVIQWQHHKTIRDLHGSLIDKIYADFKLELEAEYQRGREEVLSRSCKFSQVEYELEDERYFCTHPNINFQHLPPYGFGYIRWEQK